MNFPTFLNLAIGLIFIYLILSLFASEIQEMITSVLELRANGLRVGITRLLAQKKSDVIITKLYENSLIKSLNQFTFPKKLRQKDDKSIGPSYIPAETFSTALIQVLEIKDLLNNVDIDQQTKNIKDKIKELGGSEELQNDIEMLIWRSKENVTTLKVEIEKWFDRSMERASGAYKRDSKKYAILIGFFIALTCNADTLHIVSRLSKEQAIGNSISMYVLEARKSCLAKTEPDDSPSCVIDSGDLTKISLPIGWQSSDFKFKSTPLENIFAVFSKVFGWALTGLAISMGSSFWFDLLNKFLNVRYTGSKPKESNKP